MSRINCLVTLLFPLLFSPLALGADYSGHFTGTGSAGDADGWQALCATVSITIVDTPTAIEIRDQAFSCGAIGGSHSPVVLNKMPDGLYLADKKVGSYDEGINFLLSDDHVNDLDFVVRLNFVAGQLVYREDWLSLDGNGGYDQTFDMQSSLHKN